MSSRWNFPNLYYDFEIDGGQGKRVHFVFIDTILLTGNSDVLDENGNLVKERTGRELGEHFRENADEETRMKADEQWDWIESTLEKTTADFVIVAGHYPVYSICSHGPTSELVDKLIPLLEKYDVTAYLNGHDHCAQTVTVSGIDYHTIGSAHENGHSTKHKDDVPKDSLKFHAKGAFGGFGALDFDSNGYLVVTHYDGDATKLYSAAGRAPRATYLGL